MEVPEPSSSDELSSEDHLDVAEGQAGRKRQRPESSGLFPCNCGLTFTLYSSLYTHIKQVHTEANPNDASVPNRTGKVHSRKYYPLIPRGSRAKPDSFLQREGLLGGPSHVLEE